MDSFVTAFLVNMENEMDVTDTINTTEYLKLIVCNSLNSPNKFFKNLNCMPHINDKNYLFEVGQKNRSKKELLIKLLTKISIKYEIFDKTTIIQDRTIYFCMCAFLMSFEDIYLDITQIGESNVISFLYSCLNVYCYKFLKLGYEDKTSILIFKSLEHLITKIFEINKNKINKILFNNLTSKITSHLEKNRFKTKNVFVLRIFYKIRKIMSLRQLIVSINIFNEMINLNLNKFKKLEKNRIFSNIILYNNDCKYFYSCLFLAFISHLLEVIVINGYDYFISTHTLLVRKIFYDEFECYSNFIDILSADDKILFKTLIRSLKIDFLLNDCPGKKIGAAMQAEVFFIRIGANGMVKYITEGNVQFLKIIFMYFKQQHTKKQKIKYLFKRLIDKLNKNETLRDTHKKLIAKIDFHIK